MFSSFNKIIFVLLVLSFGLHSHLAVAKKSSPLRFDEVEFTAPFNLTHPIMTVDLLSEKGKEIITFSVDKKGNNWLMVYSLNEKNQLSEMSRVELPKSFYSFDISEYHLGERQVLYFLTGEAVYKFGESESKSKKYSVVHKTSTIAIGDQSQYLSKGDFLVDLNKDKKDDIYLTDFNQTHLLINQNDRFKQVSLPIKPRAEFSGQSTKYYKTQLFFTDINFDDLMDVTYVDKGQVTYFTQNKDATFDTTKNYLTINESIHGIDWWDQRGPDGEKLAQSRLSYKKIEQLKDINNDNIPDMVVRFTQSEGVLDKSNDYEVYLGRNNESQLQFSEDPTSTIRGDGTLTDIQFVDINNDKKLEVLVSGFKLGLSQIIGALLSGSIDQDVHLFYMNGEDTFNKKLKVSKEVELKFSLSSGTSGNPVVKLADLNGDKLQDLILSDDDDTLLLYFGVKSGKLFTKRAERFNTLLPLQGEMIIHDDINGDGKDDLLLKYGREDKANLRNVFKILIAK